MAKYEKLLRNYEEHAKRISRSTEIDPNEGIKAKRDRIAMLEADYGQWFQYYFPMYAKVPCAWFHIKLAKLILENPVLYVIANWFRGSAKTVHICMGIPLFLMVKKEMRFMLLIGENQEKAKLILSDIQIQLKFNLRFINDYGDQFQHGDWSEGSFTTRSGIHFHALGIGQSPRGVRSQADRPDYIVCSDVDTKKRCKNPHLVREMVDWIMEDLWGCFDEGRERFILDNNRISKKSILQGLLDEFIVAKKRAEAEGFPVQHHYSRVIAHDTNFNPAWPEKYTKDYWRQKKASRPSRSYNREYLDMPSEEGKLFKTDYIQWKPILPLEEYDALCIYGDLSYKDQGDFKALKFWGKKGREFHLLNAFVRQTSRQNAAIWLYDLYEDWKLADHNISYKIEGLFAMDEFIGDFDYEGDKRGYYVPVVADKRGKANKDDRIESTLGHYERMNVYYNIALKDTPDFEEAVDQLLAFEKGSGSPDDSPDADHGAIDELNRNAFAENFTPIIRSRKQSDW